MSEISDRDEVSHDAAAKQTNSRRVVRREYYEERLEREQCERHAIVTRQYCKAKKNFLALQKQIKHLNKMKVKDRMGPEWYQELSPKQEEILSQLARYMHVDVDLGSTKHTRQVLKNLGVRKFVPHAVVTKALYDSKLYPVPFLTIVKDYVMRQDGQNHDGTDKRMRHLYTPEQRILMSSIVFMEFPSLLKKLDYCLSPRVPDKTLAYRRIERKPAGSYPSPYLEPLPVPEPWSEMREIEWHNVNVKLQRTRKIAKNEMARQQRLMEMDIEKKTVLKMGITYPEHPLMKMFYRPPIIEKFKDETAQRENDWSAVAVSVDGTSTDGRDPATTTGQDGNEPKPQTRDRGKTLSVRFSASTATDTVTRIESHGGGQRPTQQYPAARQSSSSSSLSSFTAWESTDGRHYGSKPYGWLKADHQTVSSGSSRNGPVQNANKTKVVVDFDNSADNNCGHLLTDGRNEENESKTANCQNEDMTSEMKDTEKKVWQMFEQHAGGSRGPSCLPTRDRNVADDYSTEMFMTFVDKPYRSDSTIAQPRTPPASALPPGDDDEDDEGDDHYGRDGGGPGEATGRRGRTIEKRSSVYEFRREKNDRSPNNHNINSDDDDDGDGDDDDGNNPKASETTEEVLDELQKLPPWKQLKAVLKFLAILGDPVAGFKELIKLQKLRRWYEKRLNVNRYLTPKFEDHLMRKSVDMWQSEKSKMSDVKIPAIPMYQKNEKLMSKVTWNNVRSVKKQITGTRSRYTTALKHVAIGNAKEIYSATQSEYYTGRLNKQFKQTFYDYFPSKEDDCLFAYPAPDMKSKEPRDVRPR